MRRFAFVALIVALVAATAFVARIGRDAGAQDPLPTPKGQLGGRPSLSTAAVEPADEEPSGTPPAAAPICAGAFAADTHQGPSAGRSFAGLLTLDVEPSGLIDRGAIVTQEGEHLAVVGQATGRAIHLMIQVRGGEFLFAVGTLEQEIGTCRGLAGGSFVGPQPGDAGDWRACLGAPFPEPAAQTPVAGQQVSSVLDACRAGG